MTPPRLRALKIGILMTLGGPVFCAALIPILTLGCLAIAIVCLTVIPAMTLFFPHKLLEFARIKDSDRRAFAP